MKRKRYTIGILLSIAVICFICLCVLSKNAVNVNHFTETETKQIQLIIDAGHGGEDGGAVSLSGAKESDINLSIARKLDQMLGLYGTASLLLRTEDISLHRDEAQTIHEKKVSDLQYRVETIEATTNGVLISIHQNSYSDPQYSGAQVFYVNQGLSLSFAALTQDLLKQGLNPENNRVAAVIPESVYLLNHISCPAILVECGFLSNPEEETLLLTTDYQAKIAVTLATAWLQYQELQGEERVLT